MGSVVGTAAFIRIGEALTIQTVAGLHGDLLAGAAADGPVAIDASEVASADIAGLQLLVAAARDAAVSGRPWRIEAPSGALSAAFERAGIPFDPATGRFPTSKA